MRGNTRHPTRPAMVVLLGAAVMLPVGLLLGQNAVGTGRALQQDLRVAAPPMRASAYAALSTQAYTPSYSVPPKPLYVVTRTGEMVYSPNNAFFPQSSYTVLGYSQGNPYSAASLRRFRGYGSGAY